jgi:hypothetical protein
MVQYGSFWYFESTRACSRSFLAWLLAKGMGGSFLPFERGNRKSKL